MASFGEYNRNGSKYDLDVEWLNNRYDVAIVKRDNGTYQAVICNTDGIAEFESVTEAADAVDELLSNV